jgi:hypothetical protein
MLAFLVDTTTFKGIEPPSILNSSFGIPKFQFIIIVSEDSPERESKASIFNTNCVFSAFYTKHEGDINVIDMA